MIRRANVSRRTSNGGTPSTSSRHVTSTATSTSAGARLGCDRGFLVAGTSIAIWLRLAGSAAGNEAEPTPPALRVTADLSANDDGPWGLRE
jgi:acid phosphatase family membrane protein YuiD